MSGGYFNYIHESLNEPIEEIESFIKCETWKDWSEHKDRLLEEYQKGLKIIKQAQIYLRRIDWLESGDDGEESFFERLQEELEELEKQ